MKLVIMIAVMLPAMALRGWVLSLLWYWFVAAPFGIRGLSVAHAIGLAMLASVAVDPKKEGYETMNALETVIAAFTSPLLILLIGWLVHLVS